MHDLWGQKPLGLPVHKTKKDVSAARSHKKNCKVGDYRIVEAVTGLLSVGGLIHNGETLTCLISTYILSIESIDIRDKLQSIKIRLN